MIGRLFRSATAILISGLMVSGPMLAQTSDQAQGQNQPQGQSGNPAQAAPAPQAPPAAVAEAPGPASERKLALGPDYSNGKSWFPHFISPYTPARIELPILTNTPRIEQLIQDGKLMLSLEDAVSLALENNLNIYLQRFTPWIAETDLLRAKAGGIAVGIGNSANVVLGTPPSFAFDPVLSGTFLYQHAAYPVNNPFLSGIGFVITPSIFDLLQNTADVNFSYTQGFHAGTGVSVSITNIRTATNSPGTLFTPAWQPTLTVSLQQQLLKGFGTLANTRYIIEAKNTTKVAEWQFAQQVISSVVATETAYWELVYAIQNVKVEEAAVATSQRLYEDNQKQVEIGTLAPIEIVRANSQLATDRQNLIVAQTTQLQDETTLLNAITKDPLADSLAGIQIVPTTPLTDLPPQQLPPLQEAVQQAWQMRPEIQEAVLNLKNAGIEVKVTKNDLLPTLTLSGTYSSTSIAGDLSPVFASSVGGAPITNAGLADAYQTMFTNKYPTYLAQLTFAVPIRNRAAQADNARAQIDERQQEVQYRSLENSIVVAVRNAQIALEQDRAQVAAAQEARILAQETLDAEMKKYQLGASTTFLVIQDQRDLTAAQGTELRAKINLLEAQINYDQAMGQTLDVNHITVEDALRQASQGGESPLTH